MSKEAIAIMTENLSSFQGAGSKVAFEAQMVSRKENYLHRLVSNVLDHSLGIFLTQFLSQTGCYCVKVVVRIYHDSISSIDPILFVASSL